PPPSAPKEAGETEEEENKEAKKAATGELVYACGEGFWDTIARGKNNRPEVEALVSNYLKRGGKPNVAKNFASLKGVKEGYGLLHALIAVKNTAAVSQVLAAGANPNAFPFSEPCNKFPPLVLAAKVNHLSSVRLLLEYHADPLQRGPDQQTALHEAAASDAHDIAVLLLRASKYALLDCVDTHGATALHYACAEGKTRVVSYFIRECHVNPDITDNKGETPLHYAVRCRRPKSVARLLECGAYANPYVPKSTHTPLEVAKSGGMRPI
ncbi:ankyrin repeat-containing domain protein, partial [Syncephalastrum racemosum]